MPASLRKRFEPTRTVLRPTFVHTPRPTTVWTSWWRGILPPTRWSWARIAFAIGWRLVSSAAAASASTSSREYAPETVAIDVTRGLPSVSVPVLSRMSVSASVRVWRDPPPLMSTPLRAAVEIAAERAAAVERRIPQE